MTKEDYYDNGRLLLHKIKDGLKRKGVVLVMWWCGYKYDSREFCDYDTIDRILTNLMEMPMHLKIEKVDIDNHFYKIYLEDLEHAR